MSNLNWSITRISVEFFFFFFLFFHYTTHNLCACVFFFFFFAVVFFPLLLLVLCLDFWFRFIRSDPIHQINQSINQINNHKKTHWLCVCFGKKNFCFHFIFLYLKILIWFFFILIWIKSYRYQLFFCLVRNQNSMWYITSIESLIWQWQSANHILDWIFFLFILDSFKMFHYCQKFFFWLLFDSCCCCFFRLL